MTVQSVGIHRVTTMLRTDSLLTSLRRNTLELYQQQNLISLGRQFVSPSDDPGRAARALNLNEVLDKQSQMMTNIRHAADTLDATDVAMTEVNDLINEAHAIASQNIGSLSSSDEREAAAEVVASIRQQLVAVGNRTFGGRYLFAGRETTSQPFIQALSGVAYMGDTGDVQARVDTAELAPINLSGDVLFGALSSQVRGWANLTPALAADTRLEDLRGATNEGIRLGSFEIVQDGAVGVVRVDVSGADTIGDVVNAINAAATAAGAGFTASLTDNGISIEPGGGGVTIRDISTGNTAGDLGLLGAAPPGAPIVGADLGVRLTRTTPVTALAGGAGVDLTGGLIISNGEATAQIDLSTATTVQDILNTINNAGLYVDAHINDAGTGIDVVNKLSGTSMTIGENGGTTASQLGIRSLAENTPLSSLNNGQGVRTMDGIADVRITAANGALFEVNLDTAATIGDVIQLINDAATTAGVAVSADLASTGNGIRLTDTSGGAGTLTVTRANHSFAIDDLGLVDSAAGPEGALVGSDVNGARAQGLLTAIQDLETALRDDDSQAITVAAEDLDAYLVEFNRARGEVGARAKGMRDRLSQTESAVFATEALLGDVEELDYTEAITRFQQAQTSLQASLMTGSQILNTSLLDFLR